MCGRTELRIAPLYFLNVNLVYKVKKFLILKKKQETS